MDGQLLGNNVVKEQNQNDRKRLFFSVLDTRSRFCKINILNQTIMSHEANKSSLTILYIDNGCNRSFEKNQYSFTVLRIRYTFYRERWTYFGSSSGNTYGLDDGDA